MKIIETFARPSRTEMDIRINLLQERMQVSGIDAYVLADPNNVLWLSNFANAVHERPFVMIVPAKGRPTFLVPRLELDHVIARVIPDVEFVTYQEFPAPNGARYNDRLQEILPTDMNSCVAVEPTIPLMIANSIKNTYKITDIIDDLRAIKSNYEISRIAYACRLISEAHEELLINARPGYSQSEINATIAKSLYAKIVTDDPNVNPFATKIMTLIQNANASHDPHNFSDLDMAVGEGGPNVTVFNAVLNGYGAEIERTFFVGHVPEAARKPFDVMLEARAKVFEMTRCGAIMNDIDRASNAIFHKYGYSDNLRHRAGHGMGVTAHEGPFLAEGEMKEIRAGMVFTIEPGIYLPDVGGFRFSDTVLTTNDGLISLTTGPTSLQDLTL